MRPSRPWCPTGRSGMRGICRRAGWSRIVAMKIVGWAALSSVSSRQVYRGVAEVSVYVAESARGQGIGAALLGALVTESERNGIWTLQAGILAENAASIHLHEKAGFRVVGRRERIGQLDGQLARHDPDGTQKQGGRSVVTSRHCVSSSDTWRTCGGDRSR